MSYVLKQEDVFEFARYIGAETVLKGNELNFKWCPKCGGGHSHDKNTFSINIESGAFCCLRSGCDYHGHFVELARDFDFPLEYEAPKIYKTLPQPKKPVQPKDEAIQYLGSRGISAETVKRYEITMHKSKPHTMVFPFFDDAGKLQFIKYRNTAFKRGVTKGSNTAGTVTYSNPTSAGDAMTANLELKFAEGRLYAESKLAEYVKLATGGTIS